MTDPTPESAASLARAILVTRWHDFTITAAVRLARLVLAEETNLSRATDILEAENAVLAEALSLACNDGWADRDGAVRHYLSLASGTLALAAHQEDPDD